MVLYLSYYVFYLGMKDFKGSLWKDIGRMLSANAVIVVTMIDHRSSLRSTDDQ